MVRPCQRHTVQGLADRLLMAQEMASSYKPLPQLGNVEDRNDGSDLVFTFHGMSNMKDPLIKQLLEISPYSMATPRAARIDQTGFMVMMIVID